MGFRRKKGADVSVCLGFILSLFFLDMLGAYPLAPCFRLCVPFEASLTVFFRIPVCLPGAKMHLSGREFSSAIPSPHFQLIPVPHPVSLQRVYPRLLVPYLPVGFLYWKIWI